jgi:hypothetical protein
MPATFLRLAQCSTLSSPFCPLTNDGDIANDGDDGHDDGLMKWLTPKLQLLCLATLWAGSSLEREHISSLCHELFLQLHWHGCGLMWGPEGCGAGDSNGKNDA